MERITMVKLSSRLAMTGFLSVTNFATFVTLCITENGTHFVNGPIDHTKNRDPVAVP